MRCAQLGRAPVSSANVVVEWPWGKLERADDGRVVAWQSLREHSDDVASVFRALLRLPGLRARLARMAETADLEDSTIDRLSYLVFLHDCGKVNVGFQARINPLASAVGHIAPLAALFGRRADRNAAERALDALDAASLEGWGDGLVPLFDAILSHHGRPWPRDDDGQTSARFWRPLDAYDPIVALETLRRFADARFPLARQVGGPKLPATKPFVHAIAGLVQLADWIGSSGWRRPRTTGDGDDWSAAMVRAIGLDPSPWRTQIGGRAQSFEPVFGYAPYAHQSACGLGTERLMILEAETGAGKTEAALWRFLQLFQSGHVDGMYFALPTRSAAAQLHRRVERMVEELWPDSAPPTVMAVPGYLDNERDGALPQSADLLDGPEADTRASQTWAEEHPKRFFSAMIGVGTIDQALLAALRVKHAHLRASCLMRHFLVIDEVHASDPYMQRLVEQLLRDHLAAGGYAMLLSATLGAESRQALVTSALGGRARDAAPVALDAAVRVPYPLLSSGISQRAVAHGGTSVSKRITMALEPLLDEPEQIAALALRAAHKGAKVLVVRNTVAGALAVQRALEAAEPADSTVLFRLTGRATLHHGRFAAEDRRRLDRQLERELGRTRPTGGLVVVGTQTLEQSLDIDADFLITDLCPVDVLLQRLGRLHRHATDHRGAPRVRPLDFQTACAVVLSVGAGLGEFLAPSRAGGRERHGLGHTARNGIVQGVYVDLTVLEATRRLIANHAQWTIPDMNRQLVESGLHSQAILALLASMPVTERGAWEQHRMRVVGDELAQGVSAAGNILRRDREFMDQGVEDAARVTTRLGANSRIVPLPDGTMGPFQQPISRLSVAGWMLQGVPDNEPVIVGPYRNSDALPFQIGARQFLYDGHGLHQLQ